MLRIGEGFDRHRLEAGRRLVLGLVEIPHTHGLVGHSDGDALTHSLCDALLGACALGDLGALFSDTDPANAGRDSGDFLAEVMRRVRDAGYELVNADCTVIAEAPRLAPHRDAMRERLAVRAGVDVDRLSVKATRGEGLGPEGEGLSIAVRSVVLVRKMEEGE